LTKKEKGVKRDAGWIINKDIQMSRVRESVEGITAELVTEWEKAIALHDYVRDNIKFGFNRYFDLSKPNNTLELGIGHCNAKGELMVALFQEAGLEAHHHFVVLPKDIIMGVIPPGLRWLIPAEISHCYTEVKIEGAWCNIDSYILDGPLLRAARAKLSEGDRTFGYGTHTHSTNHWDGRSDAFSQFDKNIMLEDHGRVDDLQTFYRSNRYRNKVLGVQLNSLFRFLGNVIEVHVNSYMDNLRWQYSGN
jgi:transglutaminase-like putative cysteine protease